MPSLNDIHQNALRKFNDIQGVVRDEREQCLKDRRFYSIAGAQWEGDLYEQYSHKPKFEVNKIHLSVMRIINEYRNNRITVNFVSKKGKNDKLVDLCNDLYRADEQDSGGDEAYDNAFEEAVGGGIGGWRLRAAYEDEEDEENDFQRIEIEPIYDADSSIFFDLDAKKQDKSDARFCFVLSSISADAYKEEFNDDPNSWPKSIHDWEFDWNQKDNIFLAEYYQIEKEEKVRVVYENQDGSESKYWEEDLLEDPDLVSILEATATEKSRRKVKKTRVHKYLMSGGKILEDCGYIAGKHIPIVPVFGKRWFVDNKERAMGHVRLATDSQRLKNMQMSQLAEISALSPREKPILTPEQIAGNEVTWADDNLENYPYLLLNSIEDADGNIMPAGPVGYTKVPSIPPAMAALLQMTEADMSDVLGRQEAGEELQPNISGKAVELIQNKLDMQAYIYMSNFAKGMKRCGEIWLSMAKELYIDEGREMKRVNENGAVSSAQIMEPGIDETGATTITNDISTADLDVAVEVGPSSSSKRAATVRALTGMMSVTSDPETMQVLNSLAMMNMEGEGLTDVREYFRKKLVAMGAVEPTEDDLAEAAAQAEANAQPDANTMFLQASAAEAEAKAQKAQADTIKTLADAELSKAKTAETEAKTIETMASIPPQVNESI